ncbi:MAG: ATP-dependent DNA helicase UvrD2 [Candidatus Nanopelagicales bacterium]|nr:ATP-dependent DNA helicase UvrD2 [Candidatus Nanopelagicales bacterium]
MIDPLSTLDEQQAAAARSLLGPVVILAGAGSGKTKTVTARIAHGVATGTYQPHRTMALTFTDRAAGELGRRLAALDAPGVATRTFHSAALRQLHHFWPDVADGRPPRIQASKTPLVKEALAQCGLAATDSLVRDIATEVEWAKSVGVDPNGYVSRAEQAGRSPIEGADRPEVARVMVAYEEAKTSRAVMDFEDVLLVTIGMLQTRPQIRDRVRRAYRWFTVDEYQDVSPLQQRLLDLWLGDRDDLCVVGDTAQTIYRFAGADQDLLTGFRQRYPGATAVELTRSYRCAEHIVAAANGLAVGIPGARRLRSARTAALVTRSRVPGSAPRLQASRRGLRPRDPGPGVGRPAVRILQFPDDLSEARGVAEEISGLVAAGTAPRDIACLYRANSQSIALQEALNEAGVVFSVRGTDRFFSRPEVKEAVTRLRGESRAHTASTAAEATASVLTAMGHTPDTPSGLGPARDRWESLAALGELAAQHPGATDASELVADLDARIADRVPPDPAGVMLASLHGAKGLEWGTVFIIGAADGLLPISHATDEAALLDELRLLYVGVTRASDRLIVSWSRRRPGASGRYSQVRSPSRFLADLSGAGAPIVEPAPTAWRPGQPERRKAERSSGLATCRVCRKGLVTGHERVLGRCRDCPGDGDGEVLARLTQWRDDCAESRGVPPHVVMTNASIVRVAEAMPATLVDLEALPGMARHKIEDFGPDLLRVLASSGPDEPFAGEAEITQLRQRTPESSGSAQP